ncbi:nuclear transport factor 2A-like [Actinidia eriantha]|uniref:nuclear transport factor 2A-like n=1 Tax=Actinidia eriantha TaxID=165200 RepID=UPI002583F6BA|nr:nuclear transport factor 2A-like [Actinidia eriantha]
MRFCDYELLCLLFPNVVLTSASVLTSESLHFRVSPKRSHRSKTAAAMDPDAVVKAFVEHYYTTFDAHLYWDSSMLSFEGHNIQGSQSIVTKLTSLPFRQCQHNITTIDCQPAGCLFVFGFGNLKVTGEIPHDLKFSQDGLLKDDL